MIIFRIKELMKEKNISRYRLQQLTNWNYRRVNAFFFNRIKQVTIEELETLCEIFECDISDLIKIER